MKQQYLRTTVLFVLPVLICSTLTSLIVFQFPTSATSPLLARWGILSDIISTNFVAGLRLLLLDIPLFAIEAKNSEVLWGVYWSLFDTIILLLAALLFSRTWIEWRRLSRAQVGMAVTGLVLLWVMSVDLWLSGCCTAGPQWWPEVILLARAYVSNPYLDTINWQWIYLKMVSMAPVLKTALFILALSIWYKLRIQLKKQH